MTKQFKFFKLQQLANLKKAMVCLIALTILAGLWHVYGYDLKNKFAKAAALTFTVAPATDNVDNLLGQTNATWRFTIDNSTALSTSTDAVEITFPTLTGGDWNFTGVTASSTALGGDLLDFATSTIYVDSGAKKIILSATSTQTSDANNFIIDIKGVTNPVGDLQNVLGGKTWSVRTCVLSGAGNPSSGCASDLDGAVEASATIARRGGLIDDWSFTASSYATSTTGVEYTITFTASTTLSQGEKIYVNFPVGFDLTNATTSDQTIVAGGTAQVASTTIATTTVSSGLNAVILALSAGSYNAQTGTSTVSVSIGNITNPAIGSYQGLRVFTTTANNGLVDGTMFGMEMGFGFRPPPVDSIQIGGTNTIKGQAKVRELNGDLRNLNAEEIAQISVGMGCPDKMFFAGTKRLDATGSFVYSNLLDATYMMGIMPDNTSDSAFFDSYLQPNMLMMNVSGGETASTSPIFEIPDGVIEGYITGGPINSTGIDVTVRAYTAATQSFAPIHTDQTYETMGLSATGTGYFQLPIKTGNTWNITFETPSGTIASGTTQYWTPSVNSIFVPAGTATTTLGATSFVMADKTLNVTLKDADGATITEGGGGPNPCISIRRAGSDMMGPGGQGVCSTTGGVYQMKVPAGAFVIQIMMPEAGFKEYPINVASTDDIVDQTIVIARPTTYITGTVKDPDNFNIQGVSVMAQGSNGSFSQGLTNSSGVYTLYVSPGIYRVEAFAPSYGPLGSENITLSGASATKNFTINSANFTKITGRVYTVADGTNYEGVNINAYGSSGSNFAMSRDDGTYTLMVPAGVYTVEAWSKDFGRIGSITNVDASSDISGQNFTLAAQGYLQIKITNANAYGLTSIFANAYSTTTPRSNGSDRWTATSTNSADLVTKFSLPAGFYKVEVGTPGFGNLMSVSGNAGASTTSITAGQTASLTIALPTMAALSGTTEPNATVWASRADGPGKYNATADSSTGAYSMKIPTGYSYMVGASLPGYINNPTATSTFGGGAIDLTLTASAYNISGAISSSAGGTVKEGFIWASKAGNTGWVGSEINADGTYSLGVDSGSWTVYANAPCHNSSNGITQTGNGVVNITLTSISNCSINVPQMGSIVPSNGGTIATSSISINIPPNALGTGSSNVSFSIAKPDTAPPATLNATPISGSIQRITAADSNGTAITSLSNSIEIKMTYQDSDVPDGTSEANLQLAYWNTTTNTWDPVSATIDTTSNTITANVSHLTDFAPIYPTSEGAPGTPTGLAAARNGDTGMSLNWTAVTDATSYLLYRHTSASGDFPYLTTKTSTSHSDTGLSGNTAYYYKITASNANGESSASSASSATTCASVSNGTVSGSSCALACNSGYSESSGTCAANSSGGGGSVSTTYCSSAEYDEWQDACANNLQYRNVLSRSPNNCTLTTAQESDRKRACGVTLPEIIEETKEKIAEAVSEVSTTALEFTQKIITIASEAAEIVKANINALLGKLGFKRDLAKEQVSVKKYVKALIKDTAGISEKTQHALTNFIAYGTDTTIILGEGERAGVVNSYKSAFNKLPATEDEWNDVIKIANGRWPSETNDLSEANAEAAFEKIYLRKADRSNPHDDAAVTVIAYGLRPANRNLDSEKTAIKTFRHIYGYDPSSATAWDIVRAIAYSGATR
ncbi:carboxypeptidase regulatory-like domain-containing protein [Patescibacteria group bacterium]|nr:carboxypeptidase regulatory-like domain-containing protein [Patescibacteria group bacterium]MBU4015076.1 carboxypeptidase regulatory-like domain-containing protein [Patescibacteria group bacterium]MBU4026192.1 carboxypeptidase regulatory-like domain-containing protein [Patescibacteria group bacterium]MBU4073696.1 carboxypeptidase regulatory-like domain-containing protein [Patescibacteria group bacterium]MBU4103387.1 carboxypeptidase regulatory-like domain-containing protein [Patescibacteria 